MASLTGSNPMRRSSLLAQDGPWKPDVVSPAAAAAMSVGVRVPFLHDPGSAFAWALSDAWGRLDTSEQLSAILLCSRGPCATGKNDPAQR